jgi:hypothetical protein
VGHRALIAYERTDHDYDLHHAQWGATNLWLRDRLTERTPYGGDTPPAWGPDLYQALTRGEDVETVTSRFELKRPFETDVDPIPRARGVDFQTAITEHLDYLEYEAVYVVDREFKIRVYRPYWLGLSIPSEREPTVGHGLLIEVRFEGNQPVGDEYAQGRVDGMRQLARALIARDVLDHTAALKLIVRETVREADPTLELHVSVGEIDSEK